MKGVAWAKKDKEFDLNSYLSEWKKRIDAFLDGYLRGEDGSSPEILKAMRYSVLSGGKRLRPVLCIASAEAGGGDGRDVLPFASALEMIHSYSLIHDDLPCMDDDDYRRGKPSCHKKFGEAVAILAGDALLTEAFVLMSDTTRYPEHISKNLPEAIGIVSVAIGWRGMIGGQVMDIYKAKRPRGLSEMERINRKKTAKFIEAALKSGMCLVSGGKRKMELMAGYGSSLGMAFQLSDDIIDVHSGEMSIARMAGINVAKKLMLRYIENSVKYIENFGKEAEPLRGIAAYIRERAGKGDEKPS